MKYKSCFIFSKCINRILSRPVYISIGQACDAKYNIDKYTGSKATMFFDWLMTDIASVNKILSVNNINEIINIKNTIQDPNNPQHGKNACIIIKTLSFCKSIHDIPINFNSLHIKKFVKKYKRRYNRIINYILKNKSIIYFIRIGKIEDKEKKKFIDNIKKINPKCNFKLVELIRQDNLNNYFISKPNFISINLYDYKMKEPIHDDWTSSHLNWANVFYDINNI